MRRSLLAAVAVTALLLAGCGGDDGSADDDSTTTSPETTEASTTTEADTTTTEPDDTTETTEDDGESPSGDEELTPGGTTLAFGEAAVVEYELGDVQAVLEVTVTDLEESSLDDLAAAGLDVGDDVAGQVPYFVRYTLANLTEGADVGGVSVNADLNGVLGDGSRSGTLITIGFDECSSVSLTADTEVGEALEGCKVILVGEGAEVTGVQFRGELDEPVVWQE